MSDGLASAEPRVVTELDVRAFLRDNSPSDNLLLDDYEFTSEEIRSALNLAVDKWNETPPFTGAYTAADFPYRYHLLRAVAASLLMLAVVRYARNTASLAVDGGSLDDQSAKIGPYTQLAAQFRAEFDQWMVQKKNEIQSITGWCSL
jgi:hypothetical protein